MKFSLKLIIRKLFRNKQTSLINILGLTFGIACSFFILIYILFELSFDKFHSNYKHIYRVVEERTLTEVPRKLAVTCPPIAGILSNEFQDVKTLRLLPYDVNIYVDDQRSFKEKKFFFTENTIFDIFDFNFLEGDRLNALTSPNSIVITKSIAKKYFGNESAIGKNVKLNNQLVFVVRGVVQDYPANSHFKFEILASLNTFFDESKLMSAWWETNFYTYVLLPKQMDNANFRANIPNVIEKHMSNAKGDRIFTLQALNRIHLYSNLEKELEKNGDIKFIYIFSFIAFLIIVIVCFNFMNLSTATFMKVSREVGLRKVFGASKRSLSGLFLGESILVSIISLVIAVLAVELSIHFFNSFFQGVLEFYNTNRLKLFAFFFLIIFMVGAIAGSYPAIYLPNLKPVNALKKLNGIGKEKLLTRNVLIVCQFIIASVMISSSYVIYKQSKYMKNMDLGFDKQNILVLNIPNNLIPKYELYKDLLKNNNDIIDVCISGGVPGASVTSEFPYQLDNVEYNGSLPNILTFMVDYDFINTFKLEVIDGRGFNKDSEVDKNSCFILNQKAVNTFGWDKPIGKTFTIHQFNGKEMEIKKGEIIGVVKDFNFKSLNSAIEPLVMEISPSNMFYSTLSIKYKKGTDHKVLLFAQEKWKELTLDSSFEYYFLNDKLQMGIKKQENLKRLMYLFTILVVLLACLGLYGLVSFNLTQRAKEIAIRKVLGSKIHNIVILFYKQYLRLIIYANVISIPLIFVLVKKWLQYFAFKTSISGSVFIISFSLLFILTFLTITGITIKNSRMNPAVTLKYE